MKDINWKQLKQDAAETIQNIDTEKLTKASYTLLGASLAILNNPEASVIYNHLNEMKNISEQISKIDLVPNSQIDELMQDLLSSFVEYTKLKSEYQSIQSDNNKLAMLEKLNNMLYIQKRIFNLFWREADIPEEREKLKEFVKMLKN